MYKVIVGCEKKGELKDFKQAAILMVQEVIKKFPEGFSQQQAGSIWITDTEQKIKILENISFHDVLKRAKEEGMTKEDLGIA